MDRDAGRRHVALGAEAGRLIANRLDGRGGPDLGRPLARPARGRAPRLGDHDGGVRRVGPRRLGGRVARADGEAGPPALLDQLAPRRLGPLAGADAPGRRRPLSGADRQLPLPPAAGAFRARAGGDRCAHVARAAPPLPPLAPPRHGGVLHRRGRDGPLPARRGAPPPVRGADDAPLGRAGVRCDRPVVPGRRPRARAPVRPLPLVVGAGARPSGPGDDHGPDALLPPGRPPRRGHHRGPRRRAGPRRRTGARVTLQRPRLPGLRPRPPRPGVALQGVLLRRGGLRPRLARGRDGQRLAHPHGRGDPAPPRLLVGAGFAVVPRAAARGVRLWQITRLHPK